MQHNKNSRILIADDEGAMRNLLASILRQAGYHRIDQANDGQRALDMLTEAGAGYALAFIDIDMPAFSGLEVMAMARSSQVRCFWVIVSGHSAVDNVLAALKGGAGGFVVKPYNVQKIHDVLTKFESEKP